MAELPFRRRVSTATREVLSSSGLILGAPPFVFRIWSQNRQLADAIFSAYSDFESLDDDTAIDFDLSVSPVIGLRRYFRPLVSLQFDGLSPFDALPVAQAFPLLEWAMNWCVTTNAHQYLMCHSAVLARGEAAVLLPAPPGSGKSTLCAALMLSGWRLLSDELALVEPASGMIVPFVRPVSLKNQSISLIAHRFSEARLTRPVADTVKGTVAHLRPTSASIDSGRVKAHARLLVFPEFTRGMGKRVEFERVRCGDAAVELARNTFNLVALGALGFKALSDLVERCECFKLRFECVDQARAWLDQRLEIASGDIHASQSAY